MNPNACRVVLRPRDPLEVMDLAFAFTRTRWRPLGWLLLTTVLPLWVPTAVASVLLDGHWAVLAVPLLTGPLVQALFTVLVGRLLFTGQVRHRDVWRDVSRRLGALAAVWFVRGVALALSSLVCFAAVPLLHGALLYQPEAALLERVDVSRGIRRSSRLAGGQAGSTVVAILAWYGLLAWFALVAEVGGDQLLSFVLQLGQPFGSVWDGQVTPHLLLGLFLFQPAYAVYRLFLYVDVRTRVEGWDLQVSLRALGMGR